MMYVNYVNGCGEHSLYLEKKSLIYSFVHCTSSKIIDWKCGRIFEKLSTLSHKRL